MKLRVDANAGYSYSDAYKFIRKTCDLDLEMYEQLLDKHDFNGTKQLKRDTGVVIGVDEAINTVQEAVRYAYERAADVFVLKLVKNRRDPECCYDFRNCGIRRNSLCSDQYIRYTDQWSCLPSSCIVPSGHLRCPMISPAMRPSRIWQIHVMC